MKLATFTDAKGQRLGIVRDDGMIDLNAAAPVLPLDMISFLKAGEDAVNVAREIAKTTSDRLPLDGLTLNAPIPNPGKILAIGLNYADHIKESGMDAPKHQVWFNKQSNCAHDPFAPINLPKVSDYLDYEGELCFVIGKRCKHVPRDRAHEVIAGYFIGDDVSVRDWQINSPTMTIGKSFDTHGPMGPWLVTPDEVGDPHTLDLKCWVNDDLRQDSNTSHLIYDCFDQIEHLTKAFTLDVGDVIFSGTPQGVGAAMDPMSFLKVGDKVRIEIDKLGSIEHDVIAEKAETIIG